MVKRIYYAQSFVFATLILVIGILIGVVVSKYTAEETYKKELKLLNYIIGFDLLTDLTKKCEDLSKIGKYSYEVGKKLTELEGMKGKRDESVVIYKEFYHLLEIKEFLHLKKMEEICDQKFNMILYFYTNLDHCEKCIIQGHILDALFRKYKNILIYSFEINIENPALKELKNTYNITQVPALVILSKDGNITIHQGEIVSLEVIEKCLKV
jgi:hypothetical protein